MAILEASVSHLRRGQSREPREFACAPMGVGPALLDAQQPVRTLARRSERELLFDAEVLGLGLDLGLGKQRAVGARRRERRSRPGVWGSHGASSNTAAWAASPSPRPTNPNRSVVVALTLMHF